MKYNLIIPAFEFTCSACITLVSVFAISYFCNHLIIYQWGQIYVTSVWVWTNETCWIDCFQEFCSKQGNTISSGISSSSFLIKDFSISPRWYWILFLYLMSTLFSPKEYRKYKVVISHKSKQLISHVLNFHVKIKYFFLLKK